jgi:glycosidase
MPPFMADALKNSPTKVRDIVLPRRTIFRTDENGKPVSYYPSPVDWAQQVFYFLLPDRFSDGQDATRPAFDLTKPFSSARPAGFRFDKWAESGGARWQGGNLKGIVSRLDYLADLGITAAWIGPVWKQRRHGNEYHGYAIQNFLEVDPHFGDRKDLVNLVIEAHKRGIRVILDVIFNHSGHNWDYAGGAENPPYLAWPQHYGRGQWLDGAGQHTSTIANDLETGVWPAELQREDCYTRAGKGSLDAGSIDDERCEMKRTDFDGSFRDFNYDDGATLSDVARCFKYWIALTDVDGMRLDTLKHLPKEVVRNFCGSMKEFAANLGKADFFLVGEVGGGDENQNKYLDALELNLNAVLRIGGSREMLASAAKGLDGPRSYFDTVQPWNPLLGSHRNSAQRQMIVLDDHDKLTGGKQRFSTDASSDHQICAATAIQLLSLGIPCVYYGSEQAFAGPEKSERVKYLPDFGNGPDKFLRETMFGAPHPLKDGAGGLQAGGAGIDTAMPGFGAFGTTGCHFFNEKHPAFVRMQALIAVRKAYPALSYGRQYLRPIRNFLQPFADGATGELIAWSRILDEEELLCVVNGHGTAARGADVLVDAPLNERAQAKLTVIANSAEAAELAKGSPYTGTHPVSSTVPVKRAGCAYVEIRGVGPSETLVLTNKG